MEVIKSPGWDWNVTYEDEDGVEEILSVFGVLTIEEAIAEARFSLSSNFFNLEDFSPPAITGVARA